MAAPFSDDPIVPFDKWSGPSPFIVPEVANSPDLIRRLERYGVELCACSEYEIPCYDEICVICPADWQIQPFTRSTQFNKATQASPPAAQERKVAVPGSVEMCSRHWVPGDWVQGGLKQQCRDTADRQATRMRGFHILLQETRKMSTCYLPLRFIE